MGKKRKYYIPGLILLGVVVVTCVIFFNVNNQKKTEKKTEIKVQLKWAHYAQFAGMYLAAENGLYDQNGLAVTLIQRDNTEIKSTIDKVTSGEVQFGIIDPITFLTSYAEGKDIIALGAIYQRSPSALAALTKSGISKPSDLRGKTIGMVGNNLGTHIFYSSLLRPYKIPNNTLAYKHLDFNLVDYLLDGSVDVISIYRIRDLPQLERSGEPFVIIKPEEYGVVLQNDIIFTSRKFLDSNPAAVKGFMTATLKGWGLALSDPEPAVQATMKYATGANADEAFERTAILLSKPLIKPTDQTKIGMMNKEDWRKVYNLITTAQATNPFDYTKSFTDEYIEQIN